MTNIIFSPNLQAPIALSNPTGSLTLASDSGSGAHQANPIPLQGSASLIGAAVRMALAMGTNMGAITVGSAQASVISGLVTPKSPGVTAISCISNAPTLAIASGAVPLTFPRIMLVGVGGDQSYGCNSANGYPNWRTAASSTAAYAAIQTIGAYDIAILSGVFEGWDTGGSRDRENLTQALLKNATYTVTLNAARATRVFYYEIMNSTISGNPYAQWQTLVDANNWYLYESTGGVGTKTPAGGGQLFINYSTAWPNAIGAAGAGSSICGTNYGTTRNGSPTGAQGTARTFGNYAAIKLLMRGYTGDTSFSFNSQMGSPSAAGIFLDEAFVSLDGAGIVPNSSLDGITIAPGSQQGGGFPGLDTVQPVMARGIRNMFDQLQIMVSTYGTPGNIYYNFANYGQYANKYQFGTATLTCGLENTLHGGLLENVLGAGGSSWECFQVGNTNTGNTTYPSGWPNLLANYYQGMDFCLQPKLVGVGIKLPSLPDAQGNSITASWPVGAGTTLTTVTTGTALEYQLMRYGLCTTLLDDGYFAPGVTGYDWSRLRWYDEYGDDSFAQVNVKRGYLGTALTARPTSPTWPQGTLGVWSRKFSNGIAIVNPRGNGSQTVTLPQTYQALTGTQQPLVNNGAYVTSVTIPDGDGRILITPAFVPQPGISLSAPNGIAEGQLMTVSGGNFGSQGPTLVAYKNFSNETAGNKSSIALDFNNGATVSVGAFGTPYIQSYSKMPYGKGCVLGLEPTRYGMPRAYGNFVMQFPNATEFFFSSTIMAPSGNNYSALSGGGTYGVAQFKHPWFFDNVNFGSRTTDFYVNSYEATNYNYGAFINNDSGMPQPIIVTPNNPSPGPGMAAWATSATGSNGGLSNPYTDAPVIHEFHVKIVAPAGSGTGNTLDSWITNPSYGTTLYRNPNTEFIPSGGKGYFNIATLPGFVQNGSNTTAEATQEFNFDINSHMIWGELYFAVGPGASARIELGNASTYAACTKRAKCTVESASSWTASSITFRLHAGVFYQSLSGTYLYAIDANNNVIPLGRFQ